MLFANRNLKATTAVAALACLVWSTSGGQSWADGRAARRDPATVLLRLAEDPRLGLSPQEREYLRDAAVRASAARQVPVPSGVSNREGNAVAALRDLAGQIDRLVAPVHRAATLSAGPAEVPPASLATVETRLTVLHRQVLADFARSEELIRAAALPEEILARHRAARDEYLDNVNAVFADLETAVQSDDADRRRAALAAAADRLRLSNDERPEQEFDPARLPFRAAEPVRRQPVVGADLARTAISAVDPANLSPPTPGDLEPNEDVQITPEIVALAVSLQNRPVRIYDWVRNNVEFVPTYGSVQGSQMTLDARRGNAFDIASLLIALLRAAGTPARYVTGTVEVPVDAVMNWVGGASTPAVAQQLLGQGGVPNVGLLRGGVITAIRLDHVWVEAFIDYVPSRGAVAGGEGDTWVPLDAAFKLHEFSPRSDFFAAVPIAQVLQPGDHLFDVDESLGRITNVDDQVLNDRFEQWVSDGDDYILANGVETTLGGLVGGATIVATTHSVLPGSLPYAVIARGSAVSTLPASLRHSITLKGFASQFDRALDNPAFAVTLSLPAINSRRLGIQFDPATQADADTLAAARSGGASSLPVYLVNVVPAVKLDGVAQGTGGSVRMGSFYLVDAIFGGPDGSTTVPFQVVAGDEIVVGVTGNGLGRGVVEKRFAENAVDNAPEYLHQVQLHYWFESDYLGQITARSLGVHVLRLPSVGFFSSPLTVSYLFGSPRSAVYAGRNMDVRQSLIGAAGPDPARVVAFVKQAGFAGSYLEGSVFDQLEGRPEPAIKGISAVHLLSDAASQGIPIYRITQANAAAALPLLQLSAAVESDVGTAVAQGKTVLVPERNLDIGPWSGVGYIIQDETTGAGAYLISGGANGGGLIDCILELLPKFVLVLVLILLLILLIYLLILLLGALAPVLAGAGAAAAEAFAAFLLALRGLGALGLAF